MNTTYDSQVPKPFILEYVLNQCLSKNIIDKNLLIVYLHSQKLIASSFYGYKIILVFGRTRVQIIRNSPEKSNLNLTKIIWTRPKRIGPDQNNFYSRDIVWATFFVVLDLRMSFSDCWTSLDRAQQNGSPKRCPGFSRPEIFLGPTTYTQYGYIRTTHIRTSTRNLRN